MSRALPKNFTAEPWYEWEDADGRSTCSPDGVVLLPDRVVVLEVTHRAHTRKDIKISNLYMPLAAELYSLPVVGVQVFKHPAGRHEDLLPDLRAVLEVRPGPLVYAWHWLEL